MKARDLSGAEQRALPPQLGQPGPSRRCRGRATASPSTPRCTPTDGSRAPAPVRTLKHEGRVVAPAWPWSASPSWPSRPSSATAAATRSPRSSARRAAPPRSTATRSRLDREQAENAAPDHRRRGRARACRPGRRRSRWRRRTRSRSSTTSSTATATRSDSSSSGRRRAGARAEEILDPVYATNAFYDALVEVDGYENMEITVAAQQVQRSAFPEAYADHEADARVLASALTGNSPRDLQLRPRRRRAGVSRRGCDESGLTAARGRRTPRRSADAASATSTSAGSRPAG